MTASNNEIGRELKVSELKPRTVVVLMKPSSPLLPDVAATAWVLEIGAQRVIFGAGAVHQILALERTGPDLEALADSSGGAIHVYEYLGEI